MNHVFAYGSLLFPEIADGICGHHVKTETAILKGYKRYALRGADYPAVVPEKRSTVTGKVMLNLNKKAIELLSFYEGDEYEIQEVEIITSSRVTKAFVFVWKAGNEFLEDFDWNMEKFKSESLEFYHKEVIPATVNEFQQLSSG